MQDSSFCALQSSKKHFVCVNRLGGNYESFQSGNKLCYSVATFWQGVSEFVESFYLNQQMTLQSLACSQLNEKLDFDKSLNINFP